MVMVSLMGLILFLYSAKDNNDALDPTPAEVTISIDPLRDGPVTPPVDKDAKANQMILGKTGGSYTGLTAKATDPDPEDKVTYAIKDDNAGVFG